ncbi:MAG: hypothetical protein K0R82_1416 [Flavipsychrobacter sp.]|jgi:anti-sigma factor RsiW|nr:hypothetical protein [Flavipsychrobacter sp.]
MQQQFEDMDMQLWEYLDGSCSETERQRIAQLISSNEVWRTKYDELQSMQTELTGMETHHPSMRFTANVMDNIAGAKVAVATARYLNDWVVKGIAAFFLLMLASAVVYSIIGANWAGSNAGTLDIPTFINSDALTGLMFVNIILSLMIIDKLVNKRRIQKTLL